MQFTNAYDAFFYLIHTKIDIKVFDQTKIFFLTDGDFSHLSQIKSLLEDNADSSI
jgi:hypothetical protein